LAVGYDLLHVSPASSMLPRNWSERCTGRIELPAGVVLLHFDHLSDTRLTIEGGVVSSPVNSSRFGGRRVWSKVLVLGFAIIALAAMSAAAVAASTTLETGNAQVKGKTKAVVVSSRGVTLYALSGESVGKVTRLKCVSSSCFRAWPPYKTTRSAKLTQAAGVKGRIGRLHRIKGKIYQVTLNGHPLYTFSRDGGNRGSAKGERIAAFGGTWHVVNP
jgi:predicted lipoprotein with Yx(FWY)xxD motif